MTGREWLDRRMRWPGVVMYVGLGLAVAGFVVAKVDWQLPIVAVLTTGGVLLALVGGLAQFVIVRCPWCRGGLGSLAMQLRTRSASLRIRFCPYCGHSLDEELPAGVAGGQQEER
ncbi:MAG TPA: hypothetical protein VMZ71_12805 [Gemmataceae bacterium]|nr:hypothetical protein [Gemmataceae bacterium]